MRLAARVRSRVYDALIVAMTAEWYRAVLERLPARCRLLDVGIGTGAALIANADLLAEKDVRVTGVDVDAAYVERCREAIARRGLRDRVTVRLESIDAHDGGPYDAAYFSGSFMLLPDPVGTLRHVRSLVVPGGPVYFTQTFEHRRSRAAELAKPLLRTVTGIDFGRVTYDADFRAALAAAGFRLTEMRSLRPGPRRSAVLAVALPGPAGVAGE
jgi:cyclopropane fatty-acyl-phospholipid synthase-like methyltransferase